MVIYVHGSNSATAPGLLTPGWYECINREKPLGSIWRTSSRLRLELFPLR